MRVLTVLRSGGEYAPEHVTRLQKMLPQLEVLSDVDVPGVPRIPLKFSWPGWWAKIELLRPDIEGDVLFFDLDTTIVGDMTDILAVRKLTLLRDFYRDGARRPEGLQSSMMLMPEADRVAAWTRWDAQLIRQYKGLGVGDQAYFEALWLGKAQRWQDILPGQVVSFKVHCRKGLPAGARVVIYHGKPRPWDRPELGSL